MKVDYEYLKQLLEAFEEVPKPFPLISEISQISSSVNNQFAFHMGILHDQGFIQYLFSNGRSPFTPDYDDIDDFSWCDCIVHLNLFA